MMRSCVLFALFGCLVSVHAACGSRPEQPVADSSDELYGAVLPTDEEFGDYPKALPAIVLTGQNTIPAQFRIPAASLPPVQAQGTATHPGNPGSCEVWAAAYAMGSYTANLTNKRPISDPANTVSAAFLYMWVLNKPTPPKNCGAGTAPATSLGFLALNASPSMATVPYQPNCQYLSTVNIKQTYNTDLRIGGFHAIPKASTPTLRVAAIKSYVADSRVVSITMVVPLGFGGYNANINNAVFNGQSSCPSDPTSPCHQFGSIACSASSKTTTGCEQHGVAIVGYDDTRTNPQTGQPGAVLVMNSFGTGWGQSGFMWMSYAAFEAVLLGNGLIADPPPATGSSAAITEAFQRAEPGGAGSATHLVLQTTLDAAVANGTATITAPDGGVAVQRISHPFWSGPLYLSRRDGRSFVPGLYTLRVQGPRADGREMDVRLQGQVAAAASDRPAAAFAEGITGSNGRPIR